MRTQSFHATAFARSEDGEDGEAAAADDVTTGDEGEAGAAAEVAAAPSSPPWATNDPRTLLDSDLPAEEVQARLARALGPRNEGFWDGVPVYDTEGALDPSNTEDEPDLFEVGVTAEELELLKKTVPAGVLEEYMDPAVARKSGMYLDPEEAGMQEDLWAQNLEDRMEEEDSLKVELTKNAERRHRGVARAVHKLRLARFDQYEPDDFGALLAERPEFVGDARVRYSFKQFHTVQMNELDVHPGQSKVTLKVEVDALGLAEEEKVRLGVMVGSRWNRGSDDLTLVVRKYPTRLKNRIEARLQLDQLLQACRAEDGSSAEVTSEQEQQQQSA